MRKCMHNKLQQMLSIFFCLTVVLCYAPASAEDSYKGTINADGVFFRISPDQDSMYYAQLDKGTSVKVNGTSGDYYKVSYGDNNGYIMQKFVTLSSGGQKAMSTASKSSYASCTSISALGDAPKSTQMGSSGDDVEKLQQALKIKGYYDGVVDGQYGEKTESAVQKFQKAMGLSQSGGAGYNTIMKLFGKVSYTTVANDPNMDGHTKISQITVPSTCEKGDNNKSVRALQQALKIKGYYDAPIDGDYGEKTEKAVAAFQKAKGLEADGVAGNNTIKALFGKNAADHSYTTERLDWFNGGDTVIPKGATFEVKDVLTGKTFTVRRWSGYNHLDCEPNSAEDTATMKSIYGGEWSWNRRAILVKFNGHVYAASMNGMPHGTTTISNNDFDGQFCIHFYKSRTHETNREDEAHQSCVTRAMDATW